VRDPQLWFDGVTTMLLGELSKHVPELRDRVRAARPTENGKDGPSAGPSRLQQLAVNSRGKSFNADASVASEATSDLLQRTDNGSS
jgi:hypothetical protein